ncbi:hypothetical protein TRFO_40967 [Tritrichomonas foetus]|uniref:DUF3447 domain-containing protein n=1 Tax=Tritrichomonas foetus TaxID=1144522 RepID=A0A1J4IZ71_9EUKA|nr:hypothetical protein TRFO_40967 [Tritrichomonas foetus]|eukprot:OHS92710.1 hypothetical protein TRFO_40967 [Tritrichomonas foetus]
MSHGISKLISQLQTWLMDLDTNNLVETMTLIMNSIFVKVDHLNQFAACLYTAADYRPLKIKMYSHLLYLINQESTEIFPKMKPYLLKNCFTDYDKKKDRLFFLYKCYKKQLLDTKDIMHVFTHPNSPDLSFEHCFNSLHFFCWFAPELEELEIDFYNITLDWFLDISKFKRFPCDLKYIAKNIKSFQANNWSKLKQMRSNNSSHCPMTEIIKDDDLNIFQMLQNELDFDWEQKIEPSAFDIHWIMKEPLSIFDFAAYYGAVKIFKFSYMVYFKDHYKISEQSTLNVVHFAIAGGNTEIVRFLYSNDYDFTGAIHFAALYHQNDIADWLISIFDLKLKNCIFGEYETVLNYALLSFNTYIIDKCLKEKVMTNDSKKFKLFDFALENCQLEIVNYLKDKIPFNFMFKYDNQISLIYKPIIKDNLDIVKYLIEIEPQLINCRSFFEVPIWTAARYGRTDIVDFLYRQPGIYTKCNKQSFNLDPYEESSIPLGRTTHVIEFSKYQYKRSLEISHLENPFFINIKL